MADRVVKYVLKGDITGLQASMRAAGASVAHAADKMTDASKESVKFRQGLTSLGDTAGKVGLVASVGLGAVVLATANFEQAMSKVQAATHETAANMDLLRDAALKAGEDTAFSASEAAAGVENLAKAGVATKDILAGGLSGALDLAAAGEMEVADAAETAATALTMFRLSGEDVPHVADLLAAAAGKAQGDVSDMGMALKQAGLVASQTGLTIEETTGTLAAFASAGLIGSDAGTSFKTMLQSLTPSGNKAAKEMERLGISAYDAQGNFIGMTEFAGNLRAGLADLSVEQQNAALKTIFGSDAVRAAAVVFEQGAEGLQGWIDKTNDSGYAAETAAIKLDNLKGDLEAFMGSVETALIGSGEGSQGMLRGLVQGATSAVNAFNALPPVLQSVSTGMLAITAITGGGLWFGAKVISGVADARATITDLGFSVSDTRNKIKGFGSSVTESLRAAGQAFEEMSNRQVALRSGAAIVGGLALQLNTLDDSADRATRTLGEFGNVGGGALLGFAVGGPVGAAIGGGVAAIGSLVGAMRSGDDASQAAADSAREYAGTLDEVTGAATAATRALVAKRLEEQGILGDAAELGLSTRQLVDGILGTGDAAEHARAKLAALRTEFTGTSGEAQTLATIAGGKSGGLWDQAGAAAEATAAHGDLLPVLDRVTGIFGTEAKAVRQAAAETRRVASASGEAAGANDDLGDSASDAAAEIDDLVQSMKDQRELALAALDAEIGYQAALDSARESLKKNGRTLDITTEAGRENKSELLNVAAAWNKQSNAAKNAPGAHAAARRSFVDLATDMGMGAKRAEALARKILEIPSRRVQVDADTAPALRAIEGLASTLDWITRPRDARINVTTVYSQQGRGTRGGLQEKDGAVVDYYADGGMREHHVAQIAPAGAWRVWAEPETGGEAYIPLATAKRERSLDIWRTVGDRLGVQFAEYANGGINAGHYASGGLVTGAGVGAAMLSEPAAVAALAAATSDLAAAEIELAVAQQRSERFEKVSQEVEDARETAKSLRDQVASRGDLLRQEQQIRDIRRSLNAKERDKDGKLTGRKELRGLDRRVAEAELREAQREQKRMEQSDERAERAARRRDKALRERRRNYGTAREEAKRLEDAEKARAEAERVAEEATRAREEAAERAEQARLAHLDAIEGTRSTLAGHADIFGGALTGAGAKRSVDRLVADISDYGNAIADLKAAGASAALLQQVTSHGEAGDFRSAIRLSRALLAQPGSIGGLNQSLSSLDQVAQRTAQMVNDSRFYSQQAWNPGQVASREVSVTLAADPTAWLNEVRRVIAHEVQAAMRTGVV